MGERIVEKDAKFVKALKHIKDKGLRIRIWKQTEKIIQDHEIGKPMKNVRKGTREVYIPPFRLSYTYIKEENKIIFLESYHKDEQ
ncbi:hypothetical protein HYT56_00440 [Candidatus Woesearchaeota archaeon]|nr:hypothetical protein [Candidatus Woesearchaeota archaeon]